LRIIQILCSEATNKLDELGIGHSHRISSSSSHEFFLANLASLPLDRHFDATLSRRDHDTRDCSAQQSLLIARRRTCSRPDSANVLRDPADPLPLEIIELSRQLLQALLGLSTDVRGDYQRFIPSSLQ
jgi:hypothetical protein